MLKLMRTIWTKSILHSIKKTCKKEKWTVVKIFRFINSMKLLRSLFKRLLKRSVKIFRRKLRNQKGWNYRTWLLSKIILERVKLKKRKKLMNLIRKTKKLMIKKKLKEKMMTIFWEYLLRHSKMKEEINLKAQSLQFLQVILWA